MKELSIEEKAKAYDNALEVLHKYDGVNIMFSQSLKEEMFPELKESEGERVKRILHSISSKISSHLRNIFTEEEFQCFDAWSNAWFEKQGKEKYTVYNPEDLVLVKAKDYKPTDKIWSEEDEDTIKFLISHFCVSHCNRSFQFTSNKLITHDELLEKIRNLRPQSQWRPSEEQMIALKCAITTADEKWVCMNTKDLESLYEDLRKLK